LPDRLGWEVVEEVGGQVEVGAVATVLCGRDAGYDRSSVVPPLPSRLAGNPGSSR
jgi:hypothetical protein